MFDRVRDYIQEQRAGLRVLLSGRPPEPPGGGESELGEYKTLNPATDPPPLRYVEIDKPVGFPGRDKPDRVPGDLGGGLEEIAAWMPEGYRLRVLVDRDGFQLMPERFDGAPVRWGGNHQPHAVANAVNACWEDSDDIDRAVEELLGTVPGGNTCNP